MEKRITLTKSYKRAYDFLLDYYIRFHRSPSFRTWASGINLTVGRLSQIVVELKRDGFIEAETGERYFKYRPVINPEKAIKTVDPDWVKTEIPHKNLDLS